MTLFPTNPIGPQCARARRSDPETSHEAARKVEKSGKAETHRKIILKCVREYEGRTSAEIAWILDMDRHAVARRLPELEKSGQVRKGETRKSFTNGSMMVTWYPTEDKR